MSEQTVGWALHALEPDEELDIVEHLAGCEECRRTAADVAGVTTGLATALPQHDPSPRLRESIVEQARHTPQVHRDADERPVPGDRLDPPVRPTGRHGRPVPPQGAAARPSVPGPQPAPVRARSSPTEDDGRPPAGPGRPRGRRRRVGRMLVAAAAVVAVLVGGGVLVGEIQSLRAERDATLAQAQQMEGVLAAIARPGTEHAFLAPEPGAPAVAAVIVQDDRREIVPMGLEPNQADEQTYVLWGLNGDEDPTAVGTFDVRSGASGPLSVASPGSGTYETYAVSLERGREAPPAPSAVTAAGQVET
ncbi:zf-HC2 domain-containing protein [Pseudonocardia parietis]|uniref:Regulator of SigK n=1 Tax=Pseudonocardia parietis TaxID=570936 RepID=A0ABS4VTH4_9PSEU|nr:zf-HC2 domain-containing protein [Pseudonocardia parietis]MBP2367227.1 hypothetical protein [Pseudonocardia parietis]